MASLFMRFLDQTQRRTTVGRTPLDERSARRRDLYLTTHNTHNRQISMPPVGFEPTISAGERPQTYALDCGVTGIDTSITTNIKIKKVIKSLSKITDHRKRRICRSYEKLSDSELWRNVGIVGNIISRLCFKQVLNDSIKTVYEQRIDPRFPV